MFLKKVFVSLLAFAGGAFLTTGSADVRIGFLGGFTGPVESLAPSIYAGAELAATHINEQGGLLGGQRLNMPKGDTGCDNILVATNAAQHLVEAERVIAIVGALCSGATVAAAGEVAVPNNILMVSPGSTTPVLTSLEDRGLVFRTVVSDAYQAGALARLLVSRGIKNIAISFANNDYGKGFATALQSAFQRDGGRVAASEAHEFGKADYSDEIASLASTGVITLVVLADAENTGKSVIRAAIKNGHFANFAGGGLMAKRALIDAVGVNAIRYMLATKPVVAASDGTDTFVNLATEAGINPHASLVANAYDATFMIALAVQKKGSGDSEGLSAALRDIATSPGEVILPGEWEKAVALIADGKEINYEGASGSHEFDSAGDVPGAIVEMGIRDGEFVELGRLD